MTLGSAMVNVITGLTVTARSTAVVSNNLSNVDTYGYSRRESLQSAAVLGGARVDGVQRVVNEALLKEKRTVEAENAALTAHSAFFKKIERATGNAGNGGGLSAAVNTFRDRLIAATEDPSDEATLIQIATAAKDIVTKLNASSKAVQAERSNADAAIAKDVKTLNRELERVSTLNRLIAVTTTKGGDATTHMDQRQAALDEINKIVPVQVVQRDYSRVAVFTYQGAPLLDGTKPVKLGFNPVGAITETMEVGKPPISGLIVSEEELPLTQMQAFSGGTLAANFQIRDELAPEIQQELDLLALDLHLRFSSGAVDDTENSSTQPVNNKGLFVYSGSAASSNTPVASATSNANTLPKDKYGEENYAGHDEYDGLAARISINSKVDPDGTVQEYWRLRSGIGADGPNPEGATEQLNKFKNALNWSVRAPNKDIFIGDENFIERVSDFESRIGTRRVNSENKEISSSNRLGVITHNFLAEGVDSDTELQRLIQLEHAFAANARVVQAIDTMMSEILRW